MPRKKTLAEKPKKARQKRAVAPFAPQNAGGAVHAAAQPGVWTALLGFFCRRGFIIQILAAGLALFGLHYFYSNAVDNLTRQHIASGFGFLDMRAGISIPDSLIPYSSDSSYKTALAAGFVNTVFMSVLCIFAATVLGFSIAFGRLSKNWLLSKLCLAYMEIFRNIPVLLVILFVYFGVLQQYLPPVRESLSLPFHIYINQRGVYFPAFHWSSAASSGDFYLLCAAAGMAGLRLAAQCFFPVRRSLPRRAVKAAGWGALALCLYGLCRNFTVDMPQSGRFNIVGGRSVSPEFAALFLGLSLYTAALISETVRAGINGVDKGLKEAGASLGMTQAQLARAVIMPLALRIIVPPLSGQYMNAAKNTSLAVAIGYSDLMRVGSTVLIQTNQSVEVVLIWIIAYLLICLIISALMNWLNYQLAAAERAR